MSELLKKKKNSEPSEAWATDVLDRQVVADYLTNVISTITQPFVISINAPYGTGKSFFIDNWQKELIEKEYRAVCFNAWENDFGDDLLIAIISAIRSQIDDKDIEEKSLELVKKGGGYISRRLVPIAAKGLARKVIGSEAVEEIINLSQTTDEEISTLVGDMAEDSLKKHEATQSSISDFKEYLSSVVQELNGDDKSENKNLIIFIDELDRCRPSYTIKILECLKHLFDVKGIVFILAIDDKQLTNIIANEYGLGDFSEAYIRKFIDWGVNLPTPSTDQYARFLFEDYGLDGLGCFHGDRDAFVGKGDLIRPFAFICSVLGLSLREQSQCFTEINLYLRSLDDRECPFSFLLGLLAPLKLKGYDIEDYCNGTKSCEELYDQLFDGVSDEMCRKYSHMNKRDFKSWFHAWFLSDEEEKALKLEQEKLNTEMNKRSAEGKAKSDDWDIRNRLGYISHLLSTYGAFHSKVWTRGTFAQSVYTKLEKISNLTSHAP